MDKGDLAEQEKSVDKVTIQQSVQEGLSTTLNHLL